MLFRSDVTDEQGVLATVATIFNEGGVSIAALEQTSVETDDGESRRYITEDAYSTTTFESVQDGKDISFKIHAREDHNPDVYTPDERSYNLKFNHIAEINGVTINGTSIEAAESLEAYNAVSRPIGWMQKTISSMCARRIRAKRST